jgi:hypothetical protein
LVNALTQISDNAKYGKYVWGLEYLTYYVNKLILNSIIKIIFSGDSTTFGVGITNSAYLLNELAKAFLNKCGYYNVTSINAGHSSMLTSSWQGTYLAEDMAQNPDLYVVRWGFNDGSLPVDTRLDTFTNALRGGLATLRAAKTADQMSVILMTPNAANDDAFGRNAAWFEAVLPVVKQAAKDFHCCFVDTYSYMMDSANVLWQDTPMGDGGISRIHPLEAGNARIVSLLSEPLVPTVLRNYANSESFKNLPLSNSWANLGSSNATAQYLKYSNGEVEVKGVVSGGTITAGTVIGTLPVGYRPLQNFYHAVVTNGGWGLVQVFSDGTIKTVTVSSAWVDFGRMKFKAEQ